MRGKPCLLDQLRMWKTKKYWNNWDLWTLYSGYRPFIISKILTPCDLMGLQLVCWCLSRVVINIMKDELEIVKELPPHLEPLDMEGNGSLVCHFLLYILLAVIYFHPFWEHCLNFFSCFCRLQMLIFQRRQSPRNMSKKYFLSY